METLFGVVLGSMTWLQLETERVIRAQPGPILEPYLEPSLKTEIIHKGQPSLEFGPGSLK